MTATLHTDETFRITVTAASPAAPLASEFIAGKLGIEPARVAEQLVCLPAVLADALPDQDARRMAAMLSLLGIQVRLDPALSSAPASPDLADLALHPAEGADLGALAAWLERALGDALDPAQLDRPGGLVLARLGADERHRITRALKHVARLHITVSDPATAQFDLFATRSPRLCAELSRLGLGPCEFSAAAAGAVNHATGRVLLAAAGADALLIDRAFQRFDLYFRAAPGLAARDISAFLETRPDVDRAALRAGAAPRIDADLSRDAALGFVADYAAIGIDVRARLRGRLPQSR
jgi:hypothetical protein